LEEKTMKRRNKRDDKKATKMPTNRQQIANKSPTNRQQIANKVVRKLARLYRDVFI
jgi:hypothetical protein